MVELFRIRNGNGSAHQLMCNDSMRGELYMNPLREGESLEISKDGGKTWKGIGTTLPDKKIVPARKKKTAIFT